MISNENKISLSNVKFKGCISKILPYLIFTICLLFCYSFDLKYNDNTSLVNDKLIDVCSIFFGVFIGCLYLFEKFKNNLTYNRFLIFSKRLLYLSIIIISYSFVIMLINDKIPSSSSFLILEKKIIVNFQSLFFSIYISLFSVTVFNIWRFISIILIILKK